MLPENEFKEGRWRRGWDSKWTVKSNKIKLLKIKVQVYPASYPVSNGHFCNPFLWKKWSVSGCFSLGDAKKAASLSNSVHGRRTDKGQFQTIGAVGQYPEADMRSAVCRTLVFGREQKSLTPASRLTFCGQLLSEKHLHPVLDELAEILSERDVDQRHYWIGTFYTLLLSGAERRNQAAYFTPPYLARNVLSALTHVGFDAAHHKVIDPAAGGAAFLSTVAGHMAKAGSSPANIAKRLRGMDIDRGLSQLAEMLIAERLGIQIQRGSIVSTADSLKLKQTVKFDVVIANPPYGRVALSDQKADYWEDVCHPGHINKYALFTKLCLSLAKPTGLVALLLPSSFIGGPLYDRLREFIRSRAEVLLLGEVLDREDVFADVQQDVSVMIARVGSAHGSEQPVTFSACTGGGPFKRVTNAKLPIVSKDPWIVPPSASGLDVGGATLADYGAAVRSGYFVWNREQDRMIQKATRKNDVPLIWAENINPGKPCVPKAKKRRGRVVSSWRWAMMSASVQGRSG